MAFDTNLLDVDEMAIEMNYNEDRGPVIVNTYMVQQPIACARQGRLLKALRTQLLRRYTVWRLPRSILKRKGRSGRL